MENVVNASESKVWTPKGALGYDGRLLFEGQTALQRPKWLADLMNDCMDVHGHCIQLPHQSRLPNKGGRPVNLMISVS